MASLMVFPRRPLLVLNNHEKRSAHQTIYRPHFFLFRSRCQVALPCPQCTRKAMGFASGLH